MEEPILKPLLPDINFFNCKKFNTSNKDLFSKKLGHNVTIEFNTAKKNNSIFTNPKIFQHRKIIPKNKTNTQLSLSKEENLRKIWEPHSLFNVTHKNRFWGIENNKQMTNIKSDTPIKKIRSKKEIKSRLNEKEKLQKLMPKHMIYDYFKSPNSIKTTKNIKKENSKDSIDNKKIKSNKKLSFKT